MKNLKNPSFWSSILVVIAFAAVAWSIVSISAKDAVVGTWFVKAPDAPFAYHMFVFNADGTMQQANPDAGDAVTSDSDGKGAWRRDGNKVIGKFDEVTADRTTHSVVSRGEISFEITTDGNKLNGTASASFYDVNSGAKQRGPFTTALQGTRLVP